MHVQFIHTKANQTKSPWEAYEMIPENSLCSSICFWKTRHIYIFFSGAKQKMGCKDCKGRCRTVKEGNSSSPFLWYFSILFAKALKPAFVSAKADVMPEKGCERPSPCRVAGGTGAIQQQVPLKVMQFFFEVLVGQGYRKVCCRIRC